MAGMPSSRQGSQTRAARSPVSSLWSLLHCCRSHSPSHIRRRMTAAPVLGRPAVIRHHTRTHWSPDIVFPAAEATQGDSLSLEANVARRFLASSASRTLHDVLKISTSPCFCSWHRLKKVQASAVGRISETSRSVLYSLTRDDSISLMNAAAARISLHDLISWRKQR